MTTYTSYSFIMVLVTVPSFVVLAWLWLRGGHKYSVHDTEAHAEEYAGTIKEGHGGMTGFLWVTFIAIAAWSIFYLVKHWSEFSTFFSILPRG